MKNSKNISWYKSPSTITKSLALALLLAIIAMRMREHFLNAPASPPSPSGTKTYSLVLAPSLLKKKLDDPGKKLIADNFTSPNFKVNLSFFNLPTTKADYFNEQNYLGKNFYRTLVATDADFGVLPTFEFLKLLKFNFKILPVFTYGKRSRDGLVGSHMAQVLVMENSNIKQLDQLKQKKIATFLPENELFFSVKMFFQDNTDLGLKIVLTRDLEKSFELLKQKKVDAIVVAGYSFEGTKEILTSFSQELKPQNKAAPVLREIHRYETEIPSHLVYTKKSIPEKIQDDVLGKLEEVILKPEVDQIDIMAFKELSENDAETILKKFAALNAFDVKVHEYQEPYVEQVEAPNKESEICMDRESERCKNFLIAKAKDNNNGIDLSTNYQGLNLGDFNKRVDSLGPEDKEELKMLLLLRGYNQNSIDHMLKGNLSHVKEAIKRRYELQRQEKARIYVEWLMD